MSIEAAIVSYLGEQTAVTDLVGARIYPHTAPQRAVYPHITYTEDTKDRRGDLDGSVDFTTATLSLDCDGRTYNAARAVSVAVVNALNRYRGTVDGLRIFRIRAEAEVDSYQLPADGSEFGVYRVSVTVVATYGGV